ncbi:GNAT family N-acetyltransferase [Pleionea litopenaei]|uniref:GNAT family N-acetyltransferase n=1 Tax=Pleionea litopenaei TaxID=3070815 RepID=A0AA51RVI1_9GAMM|nr:GNAT family N-acetyltransferase [Pleionea sp. HL-JVS1]WMS88411.1 GNAT family N-acetyltransferase [Pleionea sp. HL-JVS1]
MNIRASTLADAAELATLAERTFRATFASTNTPEDMDVHCRTNYGEKIQRQEISDPSRITLVVESQNQLIGYAQLRESTSPACIVATQPGEIHRLYIDQNFHGKGIAQTLMQECLNHLAEQGCDLVWLGVWEENPRAIKFYQKFDFEAVGKHTFVLGSDRQTDIVMRRFLTTPR